MKSTAGVFTADGVNLQNVLLPLATIVESMEAPLATAIEWEIPFGTPTNISHDSCRPYGWCEPRGVFIAKDRSRQIGLFYVPEDDDDKAIILAARRTFILRTQARRAEPYIEELEKRTSEHTTEQKRYWQGEGAAIVEPRIAAKMFPAFFDPNSENVDKDGLVDFSYLISQTEQIFPGVFHEPSRRVLLFAHRYFRRSLSLLNTLNEYALRSFTEAAQAEGVIARLRLDPDMIGHPESARSQIELEYWHGPKYTDEIASIPSGVAEHKSSERDRFFSGIDKTQIWWKSPEKRGGTSQRAFRTFEIEELIEDESPGLEGSRYGCRYAHAEYDIEGKFISHFDGAIRTYTGEAYLERIECKIDRAGKHADYTKLFRLDGPLPVTQWKRVLTDWYRGNTLIPEYLGAADDDVPSTDQHSNPQRPSCMPALSAFLSLRKETSDPPDRLQILAEIRLDIEGSVVPAIEVGPGRLATLMEHWAGETMSSITSESSKANLATIRLPGESPSVAHWVSVAEPLAAAIKEEEAAGTLERIAFAIEWSKDGIVTMLSIEGLARHASALLARSIKIVDPSAPASAWIEAFRDALRSEAPDLEGPVKWPEYVARTGRMTIERNEGAKFTAHLAKSALPSSWDEAETAVQN